MKKRLRPVCRIGARVLLVVTIAAAVLWACSLVTGRFVSAGRVAIGFDRGKIELARATGSISRKQNAWVFAAGPAVVVGPASAWLPSRAAARVTVGGPTILITDLEVWYVPLILVAPLLAGLTGLLWRLGGRATRPGHCATCGYDLSGTPGGRCPECGTGFGSLLRRLLSHGARRSRPTSLPAAA